MKRVVLTIIFAIIIAVLVIFLYPKHAGGICGFCPTTGPQKIEYGCLGFKYEYKEQCPDCGIEFKCMGIVTSDKKCYSQNNIQNPSSWVEVSCS